jgi:phenylacetate-CoA ligase
VTPFGSLATGPAARDPSQRLWDPDRQAMDQAARRALQLACVRAFVDKVLARPTSLYIDKLRAAGVACAEDVADLGDLGAIPVTVKQELRDSEAEHPPLGRYRFTELRDCVRVGQSTGTTGAPTTTIFTRHDLLIEHESAARGLWHRGLRPGMVATHAHPAYLYGGGALVSGAYEYFGLVNLWVPPPDTDELAEKGLRAWLRFRPDVPFQGFSLGRYLEVAAKLGLDPVRDLGLPTPGAERASERMPLMTAGIECYSYLGSRCGQSPGAHLNEDWAVVSAVDPATGRDVPDGEWGNLVVTTLDRDNGMLRYDLEEACAVDRTPCSCGDTAARGFWGGRFKDLLRCQGRRFLPAELEQALRTVEPVTVPSLEWAVVRPRDEAAPLTLRVELAQGDRVDVQRRLAAAVRQALGVESIVEVLARESLPRSGYKTTRVVEA